jgi:hypothetical protein
MTTAPTADLQALLSQPPASFAWSSSEDGRRTIGTAPGAICDIWPDHVELAAIYPPDDLALAARNGALLLLVLCALRPEWASAPDWLKLQMRLAAKAKLMHEGTHYGQRVTFAYMRQNSRASLKVKL